MSTDNAFGSFVGIYNNLNVGNILTSNVTGLTLGTTYYYRIRGTNACGTSVSSNVITYAALNVPAVPVATAGTGATCTAITANWNASANATGYRLDVSTNPGFIAGSFVGVYNNFDAGILLTRNVAFLTSGVTYYYRVRAYNTCGQSISSNVISCYAALITPAIPVADVASAITCSSINANWQATANATGYRLDISTDPGFIAGSFVFGYSGNNLGNANVTTFPVIGLFGNTTYYYRIRATNACGTSTNSNSISFTTLPVPTAVAGTNIITCSNSGAVNITAGSSATNQASVIWTSGGTGTFANANSLTTATYTPGAADISAGTVTLTLTAVGIAGCANATSTKTLTITAAPVATFSYAGTPYCSNAANPSPAFSGGGVAGTFTSTAGLSINAATGQVTLATSTPGTYTVTNTIAAAGSCAMVIATSSITINTLPVATFSYTGTPYCSNAANPSPTFSGGGVAGTFTSTAGLSINSATGQVNLIASTPGTYTVTNTIAAAGGCAVVIATSSITITTLPVATFSYTGTPYCSNAANPSPTFSGGGVAGTFTSTAGLSINAATGQVNLSASTAGTYTVTNTIAAAGGCAVVTAISSITINTQPSISSQPANQTACAGTAISFSVIATGTTPTYQWQYSPDNITWTNVVNGTPANITYTNGTTATLTVTPSAAAANGTYNYRCVVSVNSCSSLNSNSATLTVYAKPTISTAGPVDFIICSTTISQTLAANTPAVGNAIWSIDPGAPSTLLSQFSSLNNPTATFTPAGGPGFYRLYWTISNGICTVSQDNVDITVNTPASISSQPGNQATCAGTGKTFTVTASGASLTYQWQYSPNNVAWSNVVTGTPANITYANGTTATLTATPSAAAASGTYYYRCLVTVNGCSSVPSNSATLTVNINSTISFSSAPGTDAQTVCTNTAITNITYSVGGSGTGATVTGLPGGLATSFIGGTFTISGSPNASGTFNYTVTTTGPCGQASRTGTLTVTAIAVGTLSASATTICAGTAVTFTATPGFTFYKFYVNGVVVRIADPNPVFSSSTLTNGNVVSVEVFNSLSCATFFNTVTMTVNPLPTATLSADKTTICAGDNVTFTASGGTNYNFKVNGSSQVSGPSNTYSNTTLANGNSVTVDVTNGGCIATSLPVVINVNALPTGTLTPSATTICAGTNITFTASGGYTTYEFKVNGTTVLGPGASNTYSSSTLTNSQVVSVIAKNSSGCSAAFPGILITVNLLPAGIFSATENSGTPDDYSICAGAPVTFTFSTTGYSNYNFKVGGISKQSGPSNSYINSALASGDIVTVEVTSGSGCKKTFTATSVAIVPSPAGALTASPATICDGSNVTFTATSGYANYNFKVNNGSAQNGITNTFSSTSIANGDIITVEVTNSNSCITTFNSITLSVSPLPAGILVPVENSGNTAK